MVYASGNIQTMRQIVVRIRIAHTYTLFSPIVLYGSCIRIIYAIYNLVERNYSNLKEKSQTMKLCTNAHDAIIPVVMIWFVILISFLLIVKIIHEFLDLSFHFISETFHFYSLLICWKRNKIHFEMDGDKVRGFWFNVFTFNV